MTDPAPSRPTNADMPARNLMNDRVRHYGATLCVRRNADAAANPPVSVQIAAKACREFRQTDLVSPNCQSPYGLGRLPGSPVMLSSAVIGHLRPKSRRGHHAERANACRGGVVI